MVNASNPSLMWLQAGSCSGDSMSLLCAEDPDFVEFVERNKVDLLWHPSLSTQPTSHLQTAIDDILNDRRELSILCVEGSIMLGPNGSGMFDTLRGRPKKDIIHGLCQKAQHVIAIGTCASYGGVHASTPNPTDCTGLQYHKGAVGGLLPMDWRSRSGYPVINVSGCPAHPHTMVQVIQALLRDIDLELNEVNQPELISIQWCTKAVPEMNIMNMILKRSNLAMKAVCSLTLGVKGQRHKRHAIRNCGIKPAARHGQGCRVSVVFLQLSRGIRLCSKPRKLVIFQWNFL